MAQGQTIKGKTVADQNVAIKVDDQGRLYLNPDSIGGGSGKATNAYSIQAISEDATYKYFFFEAENADYYIMRKHLVNAVFDYTAGTGGYSSVYVNSTSAPWGSPTFASYGATF